MTTPTPDTVTAALAVTLIPLWLASACSWVLVVAWYWLMGGWAR
jgi:hypothetical protein